jgi:calcineurin-like phosphoesterase family protein
MNQELVRRHNRLVAPGDTVFLLGDLTLFGPRRECFVFEVIKSLRGNKILILGNHDYLDPFDYVRMGFQSVHTVLEVNGLILVHDPGMYNTDSGPISCAATSTLSSSAGVTS